VSIIRSPSIPAPAASGYLVTCVGFVLQHCSVFNLSINELSDHDGQSMTYNTITLQPSTIQVISIRKIKKIYNI
jgi:hypothetical protein